ncbi:hypothetical protein [Candidatus Tisiphia endosymbiont of Hybos culiciformis]|uniref:hypothetical protein n=1 Tax=Candidatus Tisiphia endosymbiont of Hybos culiciformis TaxID=3139331 RepID=UPI003CCB4C34
MISIRWLYGIRQTCNNLQSVSQDFSNIFTKSKEETILLHKELRELSILTNKKEQQISHMTFHVDEIEKYVKTLLDEMRVSLAKKKDY